MKNIVVALTLLASVTLRAQQPTFDVASVKEHDPSAPGTSPSVASTFFTSSYKVAAQDFRTRNVGIVTLVNIAFGYDRSGAETIECQRRTT